ncbi:hypothetical protein KSP39_PZI018543 [Platanthera zijinensis]|uniref:Uncharacterized protein n=1 Tax=Platanthera zijinensis TaxID=2320716 RepID=A0AAP0B482_9ASPA
MSNMRLWVVLDNSNTLPHPIDATDCANLMKFKEAIKKAYAPALDAFLISALTLRTFDGNIILPYNFLNVAMNQNSYESPFTIEIVGFRITPKETAFSAAKRIKSMWIKNTGSYPTLSLNILSQFFEISAKYPKFANFSCCESNLVLYCRQNFHEQFEFIDKQVIKNSRIGWILGPPGTGKSSAAFAFITTLDKEECGVTWLNCSDSELRLRRVRLTDYCLWTCEVDRSIV